MKRITAKSNSQHPTGLNHWFKQHIPVVEEDTNEETNHEDSCCEEEEARWFKPNYRI